MMYLSLISLTIQYTEARVGVVLLCLLSNAFLEHQPAKHSRLPQPQLLNLGRRALRGQHLP